MLIFTQPKGQTKGHKTFFCQNLFQLMYNHKQRSNAPLRKNHKTADRKGGGGATLTVSLTVKYPFFLLTTSLTSLEDTLALNSKRNNKQFQKWFYFNSNFIFVLFGELFLAHVNDAVRQPGVREALGGEERWPWEGRRCLDSSWSCKVLMLMLILQADDADADLTSWWCWR